MTFVLGLRFKPCEKDKSDYCLHNRVHKNCKETIKVCHYPSMENPLCMCDCFDKCPRQYRIIEHDKDIYILYQCNDCSFMLKNYKSVIKKVLEPLKSKYLYFSNDLEHLCKKILPKDTGSDDLDLIVSFFTNAMKVTNTRV